MILKIQGNIRFSIITILVLLNVFDIIKALKHDLK